MNGFTADLETYLERIQSWSPTNEDATTFRMTADEGIEASITDIEAEIDGLREIINRNAPALRNYPDISQTLFEITVETADQDPRMTTDPSWLFADWYTTHPQASVATADVEAALDRLETIADPSFGNRDSETLYYEAISLGRILTACVPDHGRTIIHFAGTGIEALPSLGSFGGADPGSRVAAGVAKASANILQALAAHDPPGLADQLHDHRQQLYTLCPSPRYGGITTSDNESDAIVSTALRLVRRLATEYPDALEPIVPSLIDNVGRDYVFETLQTFARARPESLLNSLDALETMIERGRAFDPAVGDAVGEVDYPDRVGRLLETTAREAPDTFWRALDDWLTADSQPNPRVLRVMLASVADCYEPDMNLSTRRATLEAIVEHPDWQIRELAVKILAVVDHSETEALLEELATDPIPEVKEAARDALAGRD